MDIPRKILECSKLPCWHIAYSHYVLVEQWKIAKKRHENCNTAIRTKEKCIDRHRDGQRERECVTETRKYATHFECFSHASFHIEIFIACRHCGVCGYTQNFIYTDTHWDRILNFRIAQSTRTSSMFRHYLAENDGWFYATHSLWHAWYMPRNVCISIEAYRTAWTTFFFYFIIT